MAKVYMSVDDGGGRELVKGVELPSNANSRKPVESLGVKVRVKQRSVVPEILKNVLLDVVKPSVKELIDEAARYMLDRFLYGSVGGSRAKPQNRQYTPYSGSFGSRSPSTRPPSGFLEPRRRRNSLSDIVFNTREEAGIIYDGILNLFEEYGAVSVADAYELCGVKSEFTDQNWGWTDLHGIEIRRIRDGFTIILPQVVSLR